MFHALFEGLFAGFGFFLGFLLAVIAILKFNFGLLAKFGHDAVIFIEQKATALTHKKTAPAVTPSPAAVIPPPVSATAQPFIGSTPTVAVTPVIPPPTETVVVVDETHRGAVENRLDGHNA